MLYKQCWCLFNADIAANNVLYFSLTLPSPPVWWLDRQLSSWPVSPPPRHLPTSLPWVASTLGLFPHKLRLSMDSLLPLWPPPQVTLLNYRYYRLLLKLNNCRAFCLLSTTQMRSISGCERWEIYSSDRLRLRLCNMILVTYIVQKQNKYS